MHLRNVEKMVYQFGLVLSYGEEQGKKFNGYSIKNIRFIIVLVTTTANTEV